MSRLRRHAFFSLLFAALPVATARGQEGVRFLHEFGADLEPGSYRVQFDDRGAGIVFAQTKDHFADVEARQRTPHGPGDWMLLIWSDRDYAFTVAERGQRRFAAGLSTAPWQREAVADGVHFRIDSDNGLRLHKIFRHRPGQRGLTVELRLENISYTGAADERLLLELVGPSLVSRSEGSLLGNLAVAIAQPVGGEPVHMAPPGDGRRTGLLSVAGRELAMAGTTNRFFGGFLFPLDDGAKQAVQDIQVESGPAVGDADLEVPAFAMPRALFELVLPVPAAGTASTATFGLYLGPKSFRVFAESEAHQRFLPILDVDLEPPCCGSIVVPGGLQMATMLVKLLTWLHDIVGQWGVAIMLLTILVRACLAPLNFRMQKSMREYGKRMTVVKPKLDALRAKYADDQKAMQQAMLQFQREHKLMPPLGGCLPIFLTMPIYIGLFTALRTVYELRHESFLWIHDLSLADRLFALPFWGLWFNLLPIVWLVLMVVLQLRMPLPTDPQQRQMQQMMRYMPLIFGVLMYNYAAGLLVYMVTSMLVTFVESAVTKRILGPIDPNAAAMAPTPVM